MAGTVRVEGAKELRRAIRKAQDQGMKEALKAANKDGAEIVAKEAKLLVPVLSGALKESIRALGSQKEGRVAAGKGKTRTYAAIQHFGNPHHNIEPTLFLYDARDNRITEVFAAYEKQLNKLVEQVTTK